MNLKGRNFLDHLHPALVRSRTLSPMTTLGFGIACLTCFVILAATGFSLFLYYIPDTSLAYERILHITTTLHYGGLVRSLHFTAANALIILSVLHLSRVFLTGAYKGRVLNWIYGLALFFLILLAAFTGYLLPWDQISYWAARVGAGLAESFPLIGPEAQRMVLGGTEVGEETLLRAFAIHAAGIPMLMVILISLHLWRIRRDGGLAAPEKDVDRIPAVPWLYRAEGGVAFLTFAILIVVALIFPAPLYERADPLHPPNPAKAPWYFVGLQEMLAHSVFLGGFVVPVFILFFLFLAPLLDTSPSPGGKWLASDRAGWNSTFLLILIGQTVLIIIGQWFRGPNWSFRIPF